MIEKFAEYLPENEVLRRKDQSCPIRCLPPKPEGCLLYPSIDLLDCRAAACTRCVSTETTSRHTTFGHLSTAAGSLVHLHHDRVHNAFKLLLLRLKLVLLCELILVQPI